MSSALFGSYGVVFRTGKDCVVSQTIFGVRGARPYHTQLTHRGPTHEYLLMRWSESHISLKCQRYMTFTPSRQQ